MQACALHDAFLDVRGIKTQTRNLDLPLAISSYSSAYFMTIGKTSSQANGYFFLISIRLYISI